MSFHDAKKCFLENTQLVGNAMSDPQNFNLNSGLWVITDQLDKELKTVNHKLDMILTLLQRR